MGALIYIAVTVGLLAFTISTGSCAAEQYRRGNLTSVLTGGERYARIRLTTCGFARGVLPQLVDAVPCQVWNLMPLTGIGIIAFVWLLRDLTGLTRRSHE